jgi:drug/metabolite transporter (DMT)-like permease
MNAYAALGMIATPHVTIALQTADNPLPFGLFPATTAAMQKAEVKANIYLLLTAIIWGTGFVAQRAGMDNVGPFIFNGLRFTLGTLSLIPLIVWQARKGPSIPGETARDKRFFFKGMIWAGLALFGGVSLQQIGIVHTTAGKAGFITGLYVVIVPFMGLFLGQRASLGGGIGAILAAAGLFFLSVNEDFRLAPGDAWVLASAFIWAGHVLILGWLSPKLDCVKLAAGQFAVCALLSLLTALIFETNTWNGVMAAAVPIIYGGIMPVGVAYTLQVVGQKHARPTPAAIILSLESAFAALSGWVVLNELMDSRAVMGCALMFTGMLVTQVWPDRKKRG